MHAFLKSAQFLFRNSETECQIVAKSDLVPNCSLRHNSPPTRKELSSSDTLAKIESCVKWHKILNSRDKKHSRSPFKKMNSASKLYLTPVKPQLLQYNLTRDLMLFYHSNKIKA